MPITIDNRNVPLRINLGFVEGHSDGEQPCFLDTCQRSPFANGRKSSRAQIFLEMQSNDIRSIVRTIMRCWT